MTSLPMRRLVGRVVPVVGLVVLGLALGCGPGGPAMAQVEGKVSLDGTPIEKGVIRFAPTGGAAPAGGEITNGKYSVKVPVGESKVEISAPKVVGKKKAYETPDSPMIDITKESVPEKYNTRNDLKFNVESKPNTKDFDLTTK